MIRTFPLFVTLLFTASLSAQNVLVKPYVQPGDGSALQGSDVKVIAWLTDQVPCDFTVEFAPKGARMRAMKPVRGALDFKPATALPPAPPAVISLPPTPEPPPEKPQHYFKYTATLTGLPFDTEIVYRVKLGDKLVRESSFRTRASANKPVRFALAGDLADGKAAQNAIANQISLAHPDFLIALGDIVYPRGRVSEYMHHFWDTYCNAASASPTAGAPLMASVPVYAVIGNHDIENAKLPQVPDAFGAFYFFHPPLHGPGAGPWNTPLGRDKAAAEAFRAAVGTSYPALDCYSFDNGPVHFLVLNSCSQLDPNNAALRAWIEKDLRQTAARWRIVCFHSAAFHGSPDHWGEQKMRLLEPLFEAGGVNLVFAGHVHNYQRSFPLHFTPRVTKPDERKQVPGEFVLDKKFDGKTNTQPDGIIHMVSGGGGAHLYGTTFEKDSKALKEANGDRYVPLTAKFVNDRHSFTLVEASPERLELRAIDEKGVEFDHVAITKPEPLKPAEPSETPAN